MKTGKPFLFIWSIILIISINSYAQISPGELTIAHSDLEGIRHCTKCHLFGDNVSAAKCLDCHTEIKSRLDKNRGYHASIEANVKGCSECHHEHFGINHEIIRLETDTFNHDLTNYKLLGKHAEIKCEDCHKKEFIVDLKILELKDTYLGLSQECLSCHTDDHQGTLSNKCGDCHDYQTFKPASVFDHNNTDYELKGKHIDVTCEKCHPKELRNGKDFQKFSDVKYKNCTDCHLDIHSNDLGQDCAKCHTENSFLEIINIDNFDHDLTAYPLEGLHKKVKCIDCHKENMTEALAHEKCTDCHEDYHKNEPEIQKRYPSCSECHDVNGFTPSLFSHERHDQSAFALKGAHIATPCFSCHLKNDRWQLLGIGSKCVDCHEDNHEGFISEEFYPDQDCEVCHTENKWSDVIFDQMLFQFEQKGAHEGLSCRACHYFVDDSGQEIQNFFSFTGYCTDCHFDVHYQQFDMTGVADCLKCHGFESWATPNFDHNNTQYPLDGEHVNVSCKECHKGFLDEKSYCMDCHKREDNEKGNFIIYKINKFKCEDCHY